MPRRGLWLVCSVVMLIIAACTSETSSSGPTPGGNTGQVAQPTPTPEATTNVIKVGYNADSPPFVFKQEGELAGFDIDLIEMVAETANFELKYVENKIWGNIFKELSAAQYDVVISAATGIEERCQTNLCSQPYFNAGLALLTTDDGDIGSLADLDEASRVGVQQNTTGETWARENIQAKVVAFNQPQQAIEALIQGEVDAVIHDQPILTQLLEAEKDSNLCQVDGLLSDEPYVVVVRHGQTELLARLNQALIEVMASPTYEQLQIRWLGAAKRCAGATLAQNPGSPTPPPDNTPRPEDPPTPEGPPQPVEVDCDVPALATATSGAAYQIQAGDWLSNIAEREYGNPLDYRAIMDTNNRQCGVETGFTCIDNPDVVDVGWTIYLPTTAEVEAYWNQQLVALPPLDLNATGPIRMSGSSTVFPLSERIAACFVQAGFTGEISNDSIGTLAGFEQLCLGEIDLANASEALPPEYHQLCQTNNRQPVGFQIGTDAITIVVSRQNDFIEAETVTLDELKQILSTAVTWSQVRPEWPNRSINRYYPTAVSGTFDVLVQRLFNDEAERLLQAANLLDQNEDDDVLAGQIEDDPYGVGFFGFAYYQNNQDLLRALAVDGITPRQETVDQGTYPLLRPLYIYVSAPTLQQRPQVDAFVNFYLRSVKDYIADVGYFLPDEQAFEQAIQSYNQAAER